MTDQPSQKDAHVHSVERDEPTAPDVLALLETHLAFANEHSAPEDVHALDVHGLSQPEIQFFSMRLDGALLGVGALKQLDADHYEIKSMHTAAAARGQGVGRAMVQHLVATARAAGAKSVSLETGTMEAMAPARKLYRSLGFVECEPFGDYQPVDASVCMTLLVDAAR